MEEYNAFVGLDIHKNTIAVAIAEAGRDGESRSYGTIGNTPEQLRKLANKLTGRHGGVHFVYEAGPTGYVPWRTLIEAGYACAVTGPAQIPKKPGDRVKTDRRDALQLARLDRAGELDAIWVPDEHHEAVQPVIAELSGGPRGHSHLVPPAQEVSRALRHVGVNGPVGHAA